LKAGLRAEVMISTTTNRRPVAWWRTSNHAMKVYLAVAPCATVFIPLFLIEYDYSPLHTCLALVLLNICLFPTVRYFAHNESGIPTIAVFCGAYALQFALPIFTRDVTMLLAQAEVVYLQDSDVTAALLMAIVGICAFQAGYYWFRRTDFKKAIPIARLPLDKQKAVMFCILVGLLLPLIFTFRGIIPEQYQLPLSATLKLLENQLLVVIGVLGWLVYSRKDSKSYVVWLYGLVILAAIRGISTGMLENALAPIGVLFVVKWLYTSKLPIGPMVASIALVIFLSPAKAHYREQVWYGDDGELANQSMFTKGFFWLEQATEYWIDTLEGNRGLVEATSSAAGRGDFIHQVAHIHSLTPSVIPYQFGETYSFFAVAAIPRIVWPDKPMVGSANNFYALTYGITTEEGVKHTTFGVSLLGEAYINFGWLGALFIMMFQGILLSLLQHSFGESRSGPGGQAVFLAFFVFFLNGIGSSAEVMFGGILQNLICSCTLLLWARPKARAQLVILNPSPLHPLLFNPKRN